MTTPLLIVGAGGFSRETAEAVRAVNAVRATWELLGFADDDPARHGTRLEGVAVLGPVDDVVAAHPDASVVVCTGRPDDYFSRPRLVARLADRLGVGPDRFATIIHPGASVGPSSRVGAGSVILAGVVATAAVSVGAHVAVMPQTVLTHDDTIGDFATLTSGVRLGGSVHVGRGAYIGAGSLVRQGLGVGAWSLVGMGSLVTRPVPDAELWYGSPARRHGAVAVPADLA